MSVFLDKITELCDKKGVSITELCTNVGLAGSTGTDWRKGAKPRAKTLKLIADYFGVTVEYLKNDDVPTIQTVQDNHGIIGDTHAPVTIMNGETTLTEQETELLNLFRKLSVLKQSQLIVKAAEMLENDGRA